MIGRRIRQIRQQKGYSVTKLAERAGISKGALSQVERELANPSIETVRAIASALEVPVFVLFLDGHSSHNSLVRKEDRIRLITPGSPGERELLTPDLHRRLVIVIGRLPGGASSSPFPVVHRGEQCVLVLDGRLRIHVQDEEYVLEAGDTLYFDALMPHYYSNCGDSVVEFLSVATQDWGTFP